jgi:hypothetical protein
MKSQGDKSLLIAVIGACSAIIAAVAAPLCSTLLSNEDETPTPIVLAPRQPTERIIIPTHSTLSLEGTWKQLCFDESNIPVEIGTFIVSRQGGEYVMGARVQVEEQRIQNSIGIFNVEYDGKLWTFNSNLGGGDVGNFHLERKTDTVFEGEIRVADKAPNRTKWVKLQ